MKILITDASYKHSMALQKYLRRYRNKCRIVGHDASRFRALGAQWADHIDDKVTDISLGDYLADKANDYDMVIPISGDAVATVARLCPDKSLLPATEALAIASNKFNTMEFASSLGIPCPRTLLVDTAEKLINEWRTYPCVLKAADEKRSKFIGYADSPADLDRSISKLFDNEGRAPGGVLAQEYIPGVGSGFFALYLRGRPVEIFMHERLREIPITGGASTAARSINNNYVHDYGRKLLDALEWNGIAMVEFKGNLETGDVKLIEINPKFWGSLELALASGADFAGKYVEAFQHRSNPTQVAAGDTYRVGQCFYWPLDGDLEVLLKTRNLRKVKEYFAEDAKTNLGDSYLWDILKVFLLLRRAFLGRIGSGWR